MRILVTGAAGAIGAEVAHQLLQRGEEVLGVDCLTPYYDPGLKKARLARLRGRPGFEFAAVDVAERGEFRALYRRFQPQRVVHLAAQPGVRYSLENPAAYLHCNVDGFLSVLEACRHEGTEHLVYASSSSVYGSGGPQPYSTHQAVDHPISLYAATKKSNELMAHSYSHLFGLPTTGLRFFTVYGPWGRPDMSVYLFTDRIFRGQPLTLFNHGKHWRDFTFIEDIATGVVKVMDRPAQADPQWDPVRRDPATSQAPYRVYNIGNHSPVEVLYLVQLIEKHLGRKADVEMKDAQPGDVDNTFADVDDLRRDFGFVPQVSIEEGVERFVRWYREYHGVT